MRVTLRVLLLLAVLAAIVAVPAFGQSGPFRFGLSLTGPGAVSAVGRDGCSWTKETIKCAEPPCAVTIAANGVTRSAEPPADVQAALQIVFRAGDAAHPWLVCKAAACSMLIEHKDGSMHTLPMNRNGQRRMDELGDLDVLIEP